MSAMVLGKFKQIWRRVLLTRIFYNMFKGPVHETDIREGSSQWGMDHFLPSQSVIYSPGWSSYIGMFKTF